ncbi:hypothetical protein LY28_01629 [Ruminiclostridium sufflavum DSM 19573]|uniref:Uncharacterized protein n=1 Tax=Ruminiclostridium sufflavum DSM 19573 TaxID=1121337 RepID=A0A318XQ28_9FIRM|nr:hypothetical protein [Ruminiclostridium sufflavum]PYG87919.1 hypothetical protein LY28_01629 [Ruminiclostridium sufflavum DSM 19573]
MAKSIKKYRLAALLLAAVMLLTAVPLTIRGTGGSSNLTMENAKEEDKRIASEISNETGFSVEEIFELKSKGRTWNDVLRVLKTDTNLSGKKDKDKREDLLLNSGLDEEFLQRLKKEGFSEEDITEARMLEERAVFQLQEIEAGSGSGTKTEKPSANALIEEKDSDDIDKYKELLEKINIEDAVYFMLKLKAEFGSCEKVFDEYLYSLQAGLDLNEYIKDSKAYLKNKEEKKPLLEEQKVITLEKIEQKAIEKIQGESLEKDSTDNLPQKDRTAEEDKEEKAQGKSPLPDVPKPSAGDVKPQNPTDEIMNEIKGISPIDNN